MSHYQALLYAAVADVGEAVIDESGGPGSEDAHLFAADEIAAALTWTAACRGPSPGVGPRPHHAGARRMGSPRAGSIDLAKARVICEHTGALEDEAAGQVAEQAVRDAPGLTASQLRSRVKRLAMEADPAAAVEEDRGLEERRVWLDANPDGTATLLAEHLSADRAGAAMDRIDRLARSVACDDGRSLDQVRADVVLDLLEGRRHPYDTRGWGEARSTSTSSSRPSSG